MPLITTVTAPFRVDDETGLDGISLQLAAHPGLTPFNVWKIRLYPNVNALLRTNIGTVQKESGHSLTVTKEVLRYQGSTTASARLPVIVLDDANSFGSVFDREGNSLSPKFTSDKGVVVASEPIYGAVEISYRTSYKLIKYTNPGFINGLRRLGTIMAFHNGSVATYDIEIPEEEFEDAFELYRVTSEMVVNKDGAFEKPENWTGEPGSPTHEPQGVPDPNDPNELHERVHEAGFMRPNNETFVFKRGQVQPIQAPFQTGGFEPVLNIQVATPSDTGLTADQIGGGAAQQSIAGAKSRFGIK